MDFIINFIQSICVDGLEKLGKFYSLYRGFVYNREDPLNLNRLQLIIPSVGGNEPYLYWALPSGNFFGNGYGIQVLPQKGDLVWIEFEMGNPKRPVWKFGYPGMGEKPIELTDYNNYWFKTPKGNLVELDDTNGLIRFTNSSGKVIEISEKMISLGSKDQSDEPALLGDSTYDLLKKILTKLTEAKTPTIYGPQPLLNAPEFQLLINIELEKIRSKTVTLNK